MVAQDVPSTAYDSPPGEVVNVFCCTVLAPIVSETVAVWLYPPLVAVTVRALVPVGVPVVVVTVSVEETGVA